VGACRAHAVAAQALDGLAIVVAELPIAHYQELVRDRLFPDLQLRPVQNPAASGER
jgi:hypothetical protein